MTPMADDGFAAFYAGSYRRLLGQLFAVTGDLAEAENVLQEAYARAFARWSRVGDYDLPEAWVRRVAINLAAMAERSLRRRARALLRLGPPPVVPELGPEAVDLRDALRALPLGQRQAIVLHHLVGLPVEQVAQTLRMPAGTVKSLLSRGRRALAARLGEAEEVLYRP
jgi:RNA polymerase sigma-70 factor (sigma-E family)